MDEKYSTTTNLSIVVLGLIGIFSALIPHDPLLAQEPYEPVYESLVGIVNVSWSSDGTTLTFQEAFCQSPPWNVPPINGQSVPP